MLSGGQLSTKSIHDVCILCMIIRNSLLITLRNIPMLDSIYDILSIPLKVHLIQGLAQDEEGKVVA